MMENRSSSHQERTIVTQTFLSSLIPRWPVRLEFMRDRNLLYEDDRLFDVGNRWCTMQSV